MDTVEEIAYIVEFINDLREEIDSIYDRCIKIGKQEAYKGNQNSVLGGLLFTYAISNGDLLNALKLHKKIQEHDLHLLEEGMPDGNSEWCRINGEDLKEGEYHRQVCEMIQEGFDRRCGMIKVIIKCMKMDSFKGVIEMCNDGFEDYLKDNYTEYVEEFLKCPFDERLLLRTKE